jgi:hypothetical protein
MSRVSAGFGLLRDRLEVAGERLGGATGPVARRLGAIVTPARALLVVAVIATICLAASQLGDYRTVEVGAQQYRGVEEIAQAPRLESRSAPSAHGISVFVLAALSASVLALSVARNRRLARLLVFVGAAVIAISLLVDAPKGLREGSVGVAFEGAKAVLLGPFWVQLACGATLIVVGPLLARELGDRDARGRRRRRHRRGSARTRRRAGTTARAQEGAT